MNDSIVMVSVICNAYNHEKYIRDALEGFVMQKTTFKYEVLVHDDASSDRTAEIIKEYEIKYPDIIKPIYETENQYSKGNLGQIQFGRVRGKYIALCEGDDYWIDPYKLQRQYEALEKHPNINICAHGASISRNEKIVGRVVPSEKMTIFSVKDVIMGGGGFVATASLFYRASVKKKVYPFQDILSLDYTEQISGSLHGGMLFIPDIMCVYRIQTDGSWSNRMTSDSAKYISHLEKVEEMLLRLDCDTEQIYHDTIVEKIRNIKFNLHLNDNDLKILKSLEYRDLYDKLPIKQKVMIYLRNLHI